MSLEPNTFDKYGRAIVQVFPDGRYTWLQSDGVERLADDKWDEEHALYVAPEIRYDFLRVSTT